MSDLTARSPGGDCFRIFAVAVLMSLPTLSIFGTYRVNYFGDSTALLLLMMVISGLVIGIPLLARNVASRLFPFVIVSVSLALLLHRALISQFVVGTDIHLELFFAEPVRSSGSWNPASSSTYASMLSITVMPAVIGQVTGLQTPIIFKVLYPLLFSLVPLALYQAFRKEFGENTAFYSVLLFMSFSFFFDGILGVTRQGIAEIPLALIILLMSRTTSQIPRLTLARSRAALIILLSFGIVVSHYGVAYVYMAILPGALCATLLLKAPGSRNRSRVPFITPAYVFIFFSLALTWYLYTSGSANFASIIRYGDYVLENLYDIFSPLSRDPLFLKQLGLVSSVSPLHSVQVYLSALVNFSILIGCIWTLANRRQISREQVSFALTGLALIFAMVILPYAVRFLHFDRFYHIMLFFLSPYSVLGFRALMDTIAKPFRGRSVSPRGLWLTISMVMVVYFLFTTGFVYQIAHDIPTSVSLSQGLYLESGDPDVKVNFNNKYTFAENVFSATWLKRMRSKSAAVYADELSYWYILPSFSGIYPSTMLRKDLNINQELGYVYLSHLNVVDGIVVDLDRAGHANTYYSSPPGLSMKNRIYTNGGSVICASYLF